MDSRTARIVAEEYKKLADSWADSGNPVEFRMALTHAGVYASLADRLEREEAKGKGVIPFGAEAGLFAPFRASVVVDKDGERVNTDAYGRLDEAKGVLEYRDDEFGSYGPHRVVPVLVTPVKEEA